MIVNRKFCPLCAEEASHRVVPGRDSQLYVDCKSCGGYVIDRWSKEILDRTDEHEKKSQGLASRIKYIKGTYIASLELPKSGVESIDNITIRIYDRDWLLCLDIPDVHNCLLCDTSVASRISSDWLYYDCISCHRIQINIRNIKHWMDISDSAVKQLILGEVHRHRARTVTELKPGYRSIGWSIGLW